jgi:hypothetical protein
MMTPTTRIARVLLALVDVGAVDTADLAGLRRIASGVDEPAGPDVDPVDGDGDGVTVAELVEAARAEARAEVLAELDELAGDTVNTESSPSSTTRPRKSSGTAKKSTGRS